MSKEQLEAYGPGLLDYWHAFVRGRWIILLCFLLAVGLAAVYSFMAPPTFESTGKILVQSNNSLPSDLSSLLSLAGPFGDARNDVSNRLEIIRSEPVLMETIHLLEDNSEFTSLYLQRNSRSSWFEQVARAWTPSQGAPTGPLGLTPELLADTTSVQLIHNTDIIDVKARGGSPREAALIVDALIKAYRKQDIAFAKSAVSIIRAFLEDQVVSTQERLEQSERAAAEFQSQTELDLGVEGVTQKLIQLQKLLVEALVELEDKKDERDAVEKFLDGVRQDMLEAETREDNTPIILEINDKITLIQKLQKDIRQLEAERSRQLEARNYAKVKELETQIIAKRQEQETAAQKQFKALDQLPRYENLIQRQLEVNLAIEALQNRVEVIQREFDHESSKLSENGLALLQLQRNLEVDKEIYIQLRTQYESTRVVEAGEVGSIQVVQWGNESQDPIKPNKPLNLILASLVGLMVGGGAAFLRAFSDHTYQSPKHVEQDLGLPVLGVVPAQAEAKAESRAQALRQRLLLDFDPAHPLVNAYVSIEASLKFITIDRPIQTLMVASSLPGEGKSTTIVNLAMVFAHIGKRVLLVDADMRKPTLAELFFYEPQRGLTDAALDESKLDRVLLPAMNERTVELNVDRLLADKKILTKGQVQHLKAWSQKQKKRIGQLAVEHGWVSQETLNSLIQPRKQALSNLFILPAGTLPPNVTDFLGSARMAKLIERLKHQFDIVLFDTPPITAVPDAPALSTLLGGVLLVVESGSTEQGAARVSLELMQKAKANVLGVVLNKLKTVKGAYYNGHGYGYGYGYGYGSPYSQED